MEISRLKFVESDFQPKWICIHQICHPCFLIKILTKRDIKRLEINNYFVWNMKVFFTNALSQLLFFCIIPVNRDYTLSYVYDWIFIKFVLYTVSFIKVQPIILFKLLWKKSTHDCSCYECSCLTAFQITLLQLFSSSMYLSDSFKWYYNFIPKCILWISDKYMNIQIKLKMLIYW